MMIFLKHNMLICTEGQKKKKKHPYLFQYKLSKTNETDTNRHRLLPTSVCCFKIFSYGSVYTGNLYLTFIFSV